MFDVQNSDYGFCSQFSTYLKKGSSSVGCFETGEPQTPDPYGFGQPQSLTFELIIACK